MSSSPFEPVFPSGAVLLTGFLVHPVCVGPLGGYLSASLLRYKGGCVPGFDDRCGVFHHQLAPGSGPVICARIERMRKSACLLVLSLLPVLLSAACSSTTSTNPPSPTLTPTQATTTTPTGTASPQPLPATSTPILIAGTLTIKVNVRSGPAATYASVGQLDAGQNVQILFRDVTGAWYQILYPPGPQGRGWVASQYITVAAGTQAPREATPTPAGPTGSVIQRLNIRSGPGTNFDTLGMLDPNQVVFLTGKNSTASWFQIAYPTGPGGHGWVTAQYIQTDVSASLPVLDDYGNVITPNTAGLPSVPVLSSTPTLGPAYADGDSSANPEVRVTFSTTGTTRFIYSDQVSTPQGDPEDWVEFTPYSTSGTTAHLILSLACTGNSALNVELWQQNAALTGWGSLSCGESSRSVLLTAGQVYQFRLSPDQGTGLQFVAYTLTVQNNP